MGYIRYLCRISSINSRLSNFCRGWTERLLSCATETTILGFAHGPRKIMFETSWDWDCQNIVIAYNWFFFFGTWHLRWTNLDLEVRDLGGKPELAKKGTMNEITCSYSKWVMFHLAAMFVFWDLFLGMLTSSFIIFHPWGCSLNCHHPGRFLEDVAMAVRRHFLDVDPDPWFFAGKVMMVTGMMWTRWSADWNLLHKCYSIWKLTACP